MNDIETTPADITPASEKIEYVLRDGDDTTVYEAGKSSPTPVTLTPEQREMAHRAASRFMELQERKLKREAINAQSLRKRVTKRRKSQKLAKAARKRNR